MKKVRDEEEYVGEDYVAVEEPLEIITCIANKCKIFAIIMRTPGDDKELSLGFLYSEGIIDSIDDVNSIEQKGENTVEVHLNKMNKVSARDLVVNSSCGVCGRALLYAVEILNSNTMVKKNLIYLLPEKLKVKQNVFNITGGLHASALFNIDGDLEYFYEDVGRHNAVDKIIGSLLISKSLPADKHILQVSGRVGYEIVVKALKAGIPIVSGISAPTSLAVDLARESGITLIGFLRGKSFNIYSHPERVI